jgi:hypothetical protein
MPKMQKAMAEIVKDEFEKVGLTDEVAATRLTELVLGRDEKVSLGALRTYYELKGKLGGNSSHNRKGELPFGEYVDWSAIVTNALRGQPPALGEGISIGGIHRSESTIPSGDSESPLGSPEEA